ncbi:MAG: MaoC family dehydratase [Syntrophales bacterium]|jgi:acyl dehydratase|nr:MaoC family dehydratase [Syntrophales bacterium]MDY0043720.1 MaoC family dehydratase [Syntrophales bacterium]
MASVEEMKKMIGKEVFLSDWTEVKQDKINQFADCTGDHQWIHVDVERSEKGPFGNTIAHGFLTLCHIPFFGYQIPMQFDNEKMSVNYGLNKVRFLNPVISGSRIRDRIVLSNFEDKGNGRYLLTHTHTIEIEGQEKPACIAEALTMTFI